MTGFFLRTVGLLTVLYFIFLLPIGRKTLAQAAVEVWEETHLRQVLELKGTQMRRDALIMMHRWQKKQALRAELESEDDAAADSPGRDWQTQNPPDFDAPPVPRPQHEPKVAHPKHSRGRPGQALAPPADDDHT